MGIRGNLILLAFSIVVFGCSPLAPRPDQTKFFILAPLSDPASAPISTAALSSQLSIGLGPINFPGYLRRSQVVTRTARGQIELSAEDRWGEPLDRNFKRVLSENLAELLNTYRIHQYPWSSMTPLDYVVTVDVRNFETTSDGGSELKAIWIIKDGRNGRDLYVSETNANTPTNGANGVSVALSSDLATLSRAISSQMKELSQQQGAALN
ncbi:MAG: PqiC family protein [Candidatus Binataceae bacterium]